MGAEQAVRRAFVYRELLPAIAWAVRAAVPRRPKGSAAPWTTSVGTVKAAMSARRSVSALTRAMARMACGEARWNSPMAHCTHAGLTGPSGPPAPKNAGAMAARSAGRSRRRPATKGSYTTSRVHPLRVALGFEQARGIRGHEHGPGYTSGAVPGQVASDHPRSRASSRRASGSVLDVEMTMLDKQSKGIPIDEQANDDVVHLDRFREADRLADQAFDPCA